jgi:hypothetical protein
MAWVSSQRDFRRSEPETIDIQLRVARRWERLRHQIGCCRAISLPSLSDYANSGIVSQCGLASDTGFEGQPAVRVGARGKALLGMISTLLHSAFEQALEIATNATALRAHRGRLPHFRGTSRTWAAASQAFVAWLDHSSRAQLLIEALDNYTAAQRAVQARLICPRTHH